MDDLSKEVNGFLKSIEKRLKDDARKERKENPQCTSRRFSNHCIGCKNKGPAYSNGWLCKKTKAIIYG